MVMGYSCGHTDFCVDTSVIYPYGHTDLGEKNPGSTLCGVPHFQGLQRLGMDTFRVATQSGAEIPRVTDWDVGSPEVIGLGFGQRTRVSKDIGVSCRNWFCPGSWGLCSCLLNGRNSGLQSRQIL